ncbi:MULTISPECIES: response regulator transcription factor [unclassified Paenibacillus]|uniref:response regulator transcription factor n=1 Tax=unclassified Paenibacillus TaxID=185978 RepID=UPI00363F8EB1
MYKLIIVDDESKIRSGLEKHYPWVELGFEVVGSFPNGQAALDYLYDHPVDVVLSDVRMPVLTGTELARCIREQRLSPIVVFLSGYADFEYARQALLHGVRNYILKPVKFAEIVSVFSLIKQELIERSKPEAVVRTDNSADAISGYYEKIIDIVESYVVVHIKDASLEGAAQQVNMSPNYLSKIFKENTGRNFSDYLFEMKMIKSKELMADINLKIYHISSAIGYNNPKNFSRAFKQYHGISPREYR